MRFRLNPVRNLTALLKAQKAGISNGINFLPQRLSAQADVGGGFIGQKGRKNANPVRKLGWGF